MPLKPIRKPFAVYILICCLSFQALSAIFGGLVLVADPSGSLIHMPLSMLKSSFFHDFLIPGLILLILLGVFPAFITYGIITRRVVPFLAVFNIYRQQHWTWGASLYLGIMLILWINVEIILVGYGHFIQSFYSFWGVIILVVTLLPQVKDYLYEEKFAAELENVNAD